MGAGRLSPLEFSAPGVLVPCRELMLQDQTVQPKIEGSLLMVGVSEAQIPKMQGRKSRNFRKAQKAQHSLEMNSQRSTRAVEAMGATAGPVGFAFIEAPEEQPTCLQGLVLQAEGGSAPGLASESEGIGTKGADVSTVNSLVDGGVGSLGVQLQQAVLRGAELQGVSFATAERAPPCKGIGTSGTDAFPVHSPSGGGDGTLCVQQQQAGIVEDMFEMTEAEAQQAWLDGFMSAVPPHDRGWIVAGFAAAKESGVRSVADLDAFFQALKN